MQTRSWLPRRLIDPLWRVKAYVAFRAGMIDPAKEARLQRMRALSRRR